jgi:hypothetical protein
MVPTIIIVVMVAMAAVSTKFGSERRLHFYKVCREPMEHALDDMVRSYAKSLMSNFGRQMPIAEMPAKARKLIGTFMSDFDKKLSSSPNLQPASIIKLQPISTGHCDCSQKINEDIVPLIGSHANSAAVTCIEVESKDTRHLSLWPKPRWAMN